MTRAGIEHELRKSPYVTQIGYGDSFILTFYFSSLNSKSKFDRGHEKHMADLRESLSSRFKMNFHISSSFADIDYYRRVEGRGFYIEKEGKGIQYPGIFTYCVEAG